MLDSCLKNAPNLVLQDPEVLAAVPAGHRLEWVKGVTREKLHDILTQRGVSGLPEAASMTGYAPDGGIFCLASDNHVSHILSSEAKHQQNAGNAIERWYKNYVVSTAVAPRLACVVFASGEGAVPNGVIEKGLKSAFVDHALKTGQPVRHVNHAYMDGPSLFMNKDGYTTEEMADTLKKILIKQLQFHDVR